MIYRLIKAYRRHAKRITCTGGGVRSEDEDEVEDEAEDDSVEYLRCYVPPEGPNEATTEEYRNIWGESSILSGLCLSAHY